MLRNCFDEKTKEGQRLELLEMLKKDAYRKGEFKLSSGETSEHYINCKPVILSAKGLSLVSSLMMHMMDYGSKTVAGLTLGADPLVSGVAMHSYNFWNNNHSEYIVNALIVRKEPKGHGTGAWIEGPMPPEGSKVTVLEDVVTTGGSSLKAVEKLRQAGYEVERIVSIVDRQEHKPFTFFDAQLELKSIFTLEEIALHNEK